VPSDEVMSDPDQSARFLREAKLASAVQHPNIVSVFDFGTDDKGTTFMAMELVDGKPLDELLEDSGGTLPIADVMEYARSVAAGLAAIHAMGLVHRDLKPGNVLLHLTMEGIVVGTIKYLSPEQGQAKPVDHRADIFSFGMMLYRLLTGKVPFDDDNVAQSLLKRIREAAPPIRKLKPDLEVNDEFEKLLLKMLEKSPEERPDSAMAIIAAMDKALGFERKY
jgi:serine/threonine protein kinase